jgi:hypothetical protein
VEPFIENHPVKTCLAWLRRRRTAASHRQPATWEPGCCRWLACRCRRCGAVDAGMARYHMSLPGIRWRHDRQTWIHAAVPRPLVHFPTPNVAQLFYVPVTVFALRFISSAARSSSLHVWSLKIQKIAPIRLKNRKKNLILAMRKYLALAIYKILRHFLELLKNFDIISVYSLLFSNDAIQTIMMFRIDIMSIMGNSYQIA